MLSQLGYDLRHALRGLLRDRAFTLVALLSIGLGAGANSAIFSLVDQALFRQLPVKAPERLVLLNWNGAFIGKGWGSSNLLPFPVYRDLRAENQVFDGIFGRHPTTVHLSVENTAEPAGAEVITGSYFSVLGVRPALGRLIEESDDLQPGTHPVVVLSFDYWKNRLAGARDIVGSPGVNTDTSNLAPKTWNLKPDTWYLLCTTTCGSPFARFAKTLGSALSWSSRWRWESVRIPRFLA